MDGQDWRGAVNDHLLALTRSRDLITEMVVGLVGQPKRRAEARTWIGGCGSQTPVVFLEFDEGWEQETLAPLRAWTHSFSRDMPVLYTHTKGANDPSPINVVWRRSMEVRLVMNLRHALNELERGAQAVGCHWLTPEQFPTLVKTPFFGGNYWLARASYLRTLPELSYRSRHDAETWIGHGDPMVSDLLPGWPSKELCLSSGELVTR